VIGNFKIARIEEKLGLEKSREERGRKEKT